MTTTAKMPAGEYWVGDPCYAVPDEQWLPWLEAADYMADPAILLAEIDGRPVLGIGTEYGDGTYRGNDGNEYPVDAGLLGVVPVEAATDEPTGMQRVRFDVPFECRFDNGTVVLGHIKIDTDPEDEDEDGGWD